MKKFLVDQAVFLAFGIVIMIFAPFLYNPIVVAFAEVITAFSWGLLCRRLILLPFDMLSGKKKKKVHFACQGTVQKLEFFKKLYCCEWKFYYGANGVMTLLVPEAVTESEMSGRKHPERDMKVVITYYRLSKILCGWEPAEV